MNLATAIFRKRHSGISQNELGNVNAGNLLKAYGSDVDPSKVKQLPSFKVPVIRHDQLIAMATTAGAAQAEQAAEVLAKKTENAKRMLKAAGEIEIKSAELTSAYGGYQATRLKAELLKQQANTQYGSAAAEMAIGHNKNAYALQDSVDNAQLKIHLAADSYAKVGGF
jgi:hypothetical protein